ncbi:MAG TPA: phage regulatory CII family protein [Pseudomonadales bacterium]|nr:phage regulatory CII family protein [Pseudomonadales bacterium]
MQSHELFREVFEKKKPKEIAADLGLSSSMIYKWGEPNSAGSGIGNPLDRLEALLKSTGDNRLVQWICQRAGGFFILNPKSTPHPHQLIPATNQIVQEFADLLHVIADATANEDVSKAEAKQIRARWEELKSVTECFVAGCESGDFTKVRNHATRHAEQNPNQLRV